MNRFKKQNKKQQKEIYPWILGGRDLWTWIKVQWILAKDQTTRFSQVAEHDFIVCNYIATWSPLDPLSALRAERDTSTSSNKTELNTSKSGWRMDGGGGGGHGRRIGKEREDTFFPLTIQPKAKWILDPLSCHRLHPHSRNICLRSSEGFSNCTNQDYTQTSPSLPLLMRTGWTTKRAVSDPGRSLIL